MRPRGCPAGDTQFGMAGIAVGDDDRPRAVVLVLHLPAVDRDALVVVVVRVQELVPQAHVPERALGRAALDDERLVVGEVEAAHRVGGVAGGPPERLLRDRVRLVDRVRLAERERDDVAPGRAAT